MTKLIQSLIDKLFQRKQLGLYCSRHPIAKRQGTKWKYNDQKFLSLLTTLINNQDCVSEDRLNHASLIDEVRYNNAQVQRYRRNNLFDLEQSLTQTQSKNKWIITEGVFGMDGDIAPLPQLFHLAKNYDCQLLIDDAHGIGVLGKSGRGSIEYYQLPIKNASIVVGTFGKA